jgi:hypothetical protein
MPGGLSKIYGRLMVHETYLFRASKSGQVLDWMELRGSARSTLSAADAFDNAGYRALNVPELNLPEWVKQYETGESSE